MAENRADDLREKLCEVMEELHAQLTSPGFDVLADSDWDDAEGGRNQRKMLVHMSETIQSFAAQIFEDRVLRSLSRPWPCTLADLRDAHRRVLTPYMLEAANDGVSLDRFRTQHFAAFLNAVTTMILVRDSEPVTVCNGQVRMAMNTRSIFADGSIRPVLLWTNRDGCSISLVGSLVAAGSRMRIFDFLPDGWWLYVAVRSECTPHAMDELVSEVRTALRSLIQSFELMSGKPEAAFDGVVIAGLVDESDDQSITDELVGEFRWLPKCLDAYFTDSTKKDSIDRRIRNAIHLLIESDRQSHHAIGLALAVAATEAMLGRKGPDLTNLIAENAAVLLENDLKARSDAVDAVKRLYDLRSKVLHGERTDHDRAERDNSRLLAAAVLRAVLERRDFMQKAGFDPETPDALLDELRKGKFNAGQVTGTSESPARKLWRK